MRVLVLVAVLASVVPVEAVWAMPPAMKRVAAMMPDDVDGIGIEQIKDRDDDPAAVGYLGLGLSDAFEELVPFFPYMFIPPGDKQAHQKLFGSWMAVGCRTASKPLTKDQEDNLSPVRPVLVLRNAEAVFPEEPALPPHLEVKLERVGDVRGVGVFSYKESGEDGGHNPGRHGFVAIVDRRTVIMALDRADVEQTVARAKDDAAKVPSKLRAVAEGLPADIDVCILRASEGWRTDGTKGPTLAGQPLALTRPAFAMTQGPGDRSANAVTHRFFAEGGDERDTETLRSWLSGSFALERRQEGADATSRHVTAAVEGEGARRCVAWKFDLAEISKDERGAGMYLAMSMRFLSWGILLGMSPIQPE